MATQTKTTCIISWGDELSIPIVLITNKEGGWLPPETFPRGLIKPIIKNKKLRKRFFQACFGSVFVAFNLLFSPSRVRAMQSSEAQAVVSQAVVSQAILERPTREHQLREQASTDEVRIELLSKRRRHLLFVIRKNPRVLGCPRSIDWSLQEVKDTSFYPYYRSHPTIEAEVIERGMREYDPNIIPPSRLWSLQYEWREWCDRLQLETYRLGSLVYYRENTVLRYITSTEPHDPKITFNQADKSSFSTRGGDIGESMDNAISVAMKSVAEAILVVRRKEHNIDLPELDQNHLHVIQKTLFWKAKTLKENTENLIQKSQCEIREALNKIKQSADSE